MMKAVQDKVAAGKQGAFGDKIRMDLGVVGNNGGDGQA